MVVPIKEMIMIASMNPSTIVSSANLSAKKDE